MTITDKDTQLISLLKKSGRTPVAELARRLNVSRTAARARLDKLERSGTITGYSVRLSEQYLQGRVQALVMIKSLPLKRKSIEQLLAKMNGLESLYSISGAFDLVAIISAETVSNIDQHIDQIGQLKGVEDTMSSIILSTKVSP
ncbi:MAG: Lrp/AsnC family transcriptional regulator [Arenicellales bacterium]